MTEKLLGFLLISTLKPKNINPVWLVSELNKKNNVYLRPNVQLNILIVAIIKD